MTDHKVDAIIASVRGPFGGVTFRGPVPSSKLSGDPHPPFEVAYQLTWRQLPQMPMVVLNLDAAEARKRATVLRHGLVEVGEAFASHWRRGIEVATGLRGTIEERTFAAVFTEMQGRRGAGLRLGWLSAVAGLDLAAGGTAHRPLRALLRWAADSVPLDEREH